MKVLVALAILVSVTADAQAATFADMINSLSQQVTSFGGLMKLAFPVAGFYCVGQGLYYALNLPFEAGGNKLGYPGMSAFIYIAVGACLLAISGFALMSTESMGLTGGTIDF